MKDERSSGRLPRPRSRSAAFTLLELTVVVAIVALAAGLLLPRLADMDGVAVEAAARRLVDGIAFGRERAILGGTPMRLVLDLDAQRWVVGRPARGASGVESEPAAASRPVTLPEGVRILSVTAGETAGRTGTMVVDFAPEGDGLPARIELVDRRGRTASVLAPPGGGRAVIVHERPR